LAHASESAGGCKGQAPKSGAGALPFAALPHDLVGDRRLNGTQVRLAAVLCRYAKGKVDCWPSVATLAADMELCRRSVQLNLAALVRAGWIAARPAANPTGRVLVLTWRVAPRAEDCAPRAQKDAPSPAQSAAPESETDQKRKPPGAGAAGPPPAVRETRTRPEPSGPRTVEEMRELFASWLENPDGHPLRRIVEQRLKARAEGQSAAQAATDAGVKSWRLRAPTFASLPPAMSWPPAMAMARP
jgi:hypothetical protein